MHKLRRIRYSYFNILEYNKQYFFAYISPLPDVVQKGFCILDRLMDPTFPMKYVESISRRE